jgi:sensor histidine kinase YesM
MWAESRWGVPEIPLQWGSVLVGSAGNGFILVGWSGFYFGMKHYQALEEQRLKLLASESLAREAQLRALRYQLQPHFLFNTLNSISTLVLDNQPRVATQMIARLGDLLRSTLDAPDTHQVCFAEEIAVTEEYLAIEKMRFGARLLVSFEIAPEAREAQVPRFLLQPLIENAIRHGISKRKEGGHIAVRALILDKSLIIEVENEGMQGKVVDTPKPTGQYRGVGLVNTRARLEQFYGSAARLNARPAERGNFVVSIAIPFTASEYTREPYLQESVQ